MRNLALIAIVLLILSQWGLELLTLLLHAILIVLETLELLVDRVLESVFDLPPREAQVSTAWIGLTAFLALLFVGFKKLSAASRRWKQIGLVWWETQKSRFQAMRPFTRWSLTVIATVLVLAVFSF